MKSRLWLLAFVLLGPPAVLAWAGVSSSSADAPSKPAPRGAHVASNVQFMGAGSCAAAACHNGNFAQGHLGSEYTTWITRDRHARAYETLFEERSKVIQKNLHRTAPAHEDLRCLKCHVAPDLDPILEKKAPYLRTDGVSCESCHGAAEKWLNVHHLPAWKEMTPAERSNHGMRDTRSLVGRARVCVSCHVGAPGMDVDHDLIAAGHPRLAFEFTAFHAFMPRHWPDAKDRSQPDFEARAWVTGQLATAHAAVEILADRAGDAKKAWPEFAQHDCVACHHDLRSPSTHRSGPGKPGSVPWNAWDLGLAARAFAVVKAEPKAFANLQKELDKGWNNRSAISQAARASAAQLKLALDAADRSTIEPIALVRELLVVDALKVGTSGDRAAQIALALAALERSSRESKTRLPETYRLAINDFARALRIPREDEPQAIRKRLIDFKGR